MAADKKFKLGLPRLFRFPFLSCRHRNDADLAQEPVFVSRRSELRELLPRRPSSSHPRRPTCPPKLPHTLPALCRPRSSPTTEGAVVRCVRRAGRAEACPTAPPASPLPPRIKSMEPVEEKVEKKSRKKKKERLKRNKKHASACNTSSGDSQCFFSSDDEHHDGQLKQADQEADHDLFSSRSFSSDSSLESCRLKLSVRRRAKPGKVGRSFGSRDDEPDLLEGDQIEQSVAVVKRSSDPYADFRISMVEMIIEKQIFGAQELEKLLDCFLALNAPYHHQVIVEVFEEICEALFTNWS